jgi:GTP cyclohydrolase I
MAKKQLPKPLNITYNLQIPSHEYFKQDDIAHLSSMLEAIFGEDVWDDSMERTAERWLRAMEEFSPKGEMAFNVTTFPATVNQLITVADIEFSSLCAHHLFPFVGKCHVGYIPNKLQIGLSKIPRIVHHFATRPQTQEKLTEQIATFLKHNLEAMGVAVVIESTHTCMSARGVREHNGVMRTSEMRGLFLTASEARREFLSLVGLGG